MIGSRISELRKQLNMTQRELAQYLSVSLNSVSLYERDLSTPDDETKIKIAQLFNVSMDYLMGTSDSKTPASPDSVRSTLIYCENIPPEAARELSSFMRKLREKYNF